MFKQSKEPEKKGSEKREDLLVSFLKDAHFVFAIIKSELKKYDNINADDAQFISDIKSIVYAAKQKAYQAADLFQVAANWLIGKRIVEQEQHGRERAEYGKRIIGLASEALTAEYGKGYSAITLRNYIKFYLSFRGLQIQQPLLAEFKSCIFCIIPILS